MLVRVHRIDALTVVGDKGLRRPRLPSPGRRTGCPGRPPHRKDEPGKGPHLAPIRQCVESIFRPMKNMLGLDDHGARELYTLRARLAAKLLP
jgi:hypothetical protein